MLGNPVNSRRTKPRQTRALFFFAMVAGLLAVSQDRLAAEDPTVGKDPSPAWVNPVSVDLDAEPSSKAGDNGIWNLLSDVQINANTGTTFRHYAYQYLTESGVQENSQRSFNFDPAYQTLTLHMLRIHRKGRVIDRLAGQEIEILERETGQEDNLFDGHLTALAVLKDIRVGDVLEYAYSVAGENPIFGGRFFKIQKWSWSVTVHDARFRILWHDKRPLRVRLENAATEADVSDFAGGSDYRWRQTDTEPVYEEGNLPYGYTPYAWIELSDFASWTDFADWAIKLYAIPESLPSDLEEEIARIAGGPNDEARALGALRFVQDNIRYVGSFMGEHSHRPYPLDTVMSRRFGDCKDKSLMLVAMLRRLGMEANPALVQTDFRQAIADWLPSPFAFDHAVTQVRVDGKTHWLDPTRGYQRGDSLEKIYFPDYGHAFVISEETTGLTPVSTSTAANGRVEIRETFKLEDYRGPADLTIHTDYFGRNADSIRADFASSSRDSIEKDYLDYYGKDYEKIESSAPIETQDHPEENRFTVIESYRIPRLWEPVEEEGTHEAVFHSRYTYSELRKPSKRQRTMPYAVRHPVQVEHTVKIVLPSLWEDQTDSQVVDDPAFSFSYDSVSKGHAVDLTYQYSSKANRAHADRIDAFCEAIEKAENVTSYYLEIPDFYRDFTAEQLDPAVSLDLPDHPFSQTNWLALIIYFFVFGFGAAGAIALYFWDPEPPAWPAPSINPLRGKAGWLVLVGFGVIARPIQGMFLFPGNLSDIALDTWNPLTTPGAEGYHALWAPVILLGGMTNILAFPFEILLIVLFFRNRTSFPKILAGYLVILLLSSAVQVPMYQAIPNVDESALAQMWTAFPREIIAVAIWVPYLFVSRRVKNTFRERRKRVAPATADTPPLSPATAA